MTTQCACFKQQTSQASLQQIAELVYRLQQQLDTVTTQPQTLSGAALLQTPRLTAQIVQPSNAPRLVATAETSRIPIAGVQQILPAAGLIA